MRATEVMRPCAVCTRAAENLLDFMSGYQYELAVRESVQAEHAENGGFCPLHTWQFERIASPQGICAGYPRVLSRLAERLRSAAFPAWPVRSGENVRGLLADPDTCRACAVVAAAEEDSIISILSCLKSGSDFESAGLPPLCVPHLCRVLSVVPTGEGRQFLLRRQAHVLDRVAENMQQHTLKHEAIKRNLMTEEELHAHIHALSFLVGHPNLSTVRKR